MGMKSEFALCKHELVWRHVRGAIIVSVEFSCFWRHSLWDFFHVFTFALSDFNAEMTTHLAMTRNPSPWRLIAYKLRLIDRLTTVWLLEVKLLRYSHSGYNVLVLNLIINHSVLGNITGSLLELCFNLYFRFFLYRRELPHEASVRSKNDPKCPFIVAFSLNEIAEPRVSHNNNSPKPDCRILKFTSSSPPEMNSERF